MGLFKLVFYFFVKKYNDSVENFMVHIELQFICLLFILNEVLKCEGVLDHIVYQIYNNTYLK